MSHKNIQPWVKTALEMGPVILFFVFYSKFKNNEYIFLGETYEGFILATALFIPVISGDWNFIFLDWKII